MIRFGASMKDVCTPAEHERRAPPTRRAGRRRIIDALEHRTRPRVARHEEQISMTHPFTRNGIAALAAVVCAAALLAGCEKKTAEPSPPDTAASAVAGAAQQAAQKLDQMASFVNAQVDAAKAGVASAASAVPPLTASGVAAAAQAQLSSAASAALGRAASEAGAHLEAAGRKLQQWSRPQPASDAAASDH
jgi:hypothetical protein